MNVFDIDRKAWVPVQSELGFWSLDDARELYRAMPVHAVTVTPTMAARHGRGLSRLVEQLRREAEVRDALLFGAARPSVALSVFDGLLLEDVEPVAKVSVDVHERPPAVVR